jgi:hypothetical protein
MRKNGGATKLFFERNSFFRRISRVIHHSVDFCNAWIHSGARENYYG